MDRPIDPEVGREVRQDEHAEVQLVQGREARQDGHEQGEVEDLAEGQPPAETQFLDPYADLGMSIDELGDLDELVAIDVDGAEEDRAGDVEACPREEGARREGWLVILWVQNAENTPEYIYGEIAKTESDGLLCHPREKSVRMK